jgi:hypothetical protein
MPALLVKAKDQTTQEIAPLTKADGTENRCDVGWLLWFPFNANGE